MRDELFLLRRALSGIGRQRIAEFGLQAILFRLGQALLVRVLQVGDLPSQWRDPRLPFLEALLVRFLFLAGGQIDILKVSCRKKSLEALVLGLGNRVKFMVVAAGATDRQTEESGSDPVGHLRKYFLSQPGPVDIAADDMNLPATIEPRSD